MTRNMVVMVTPLLYSCLTISVVIDALWALPDRIVIIKVFHEPNKKLIWLFGVTLNPPPPIANNMNPGKSNHDCFGFDSLNNAQPTFARNRWMPRAAQVPHLSYIKPRRYAERRRVANDIMHTELNIISWLTQIVFSCDVELISIAGPLELQDPLKYPSFFKIHWIAGHPASQFPKHIFSNMAINNDTMVYILTAMPPV